MLTKIVDLVKSKPESLTSVTFSPTLKTKVYFVKDKTIYLWYYDSKLSFMVQMAKGIAGRSDTAISDIANPCLNILNVDLWFAEHSV